MTDRGQQVHEALQISEISDTALPEGFPDTPLGSLPRTWKIVKLGEIFEEVNIRVRNLPPHERESTPVLSMTRHQGLILQSQKFDHRVASRNTSDYKVVEFGQLVVGFPIDEGVIAILHRHPSGAVSPVYNVWRLQQEVDHTFIDWMLKAPALISIYSRLSSKTVHRRRILSKRDFRSIPIPLPPLSEQRAIADVLRTVQQAREATERVLDAVRELKRSLMRHLFTYGPVPVQQADRVELQETEVGFIPAHWKTVRLGEAIREGPQNGIYKPQSLYGQGALILRINDYDNAGNVVTRADNRVKLDDTETAKHGLRQNDILVNRVNSLSHLGKVALVGQLSEPMVFESNMMRFRINTDLVSPQYTFRFLCTPICREQMRGMAKRAVAQSSINQGDVESVCIPCPPAPEQSEIACILDTVDTKIATEEARLRVLNDLFHSLLHHLMTGKVRTQWKEE